MKTTYENSQSFNSPTARGVVTAISTGSDTGDPQNIFEQILVTLESWVIPPTARFVDVSTTASGNAIPRFYRNVPWNSVNGGVIPPAPKVGDHVMLGFSGGSSEFPHVLAHIPGSGTRQGQETAGAPAHVTPSKVQAAAFKQPLSPAPTILPLDNRPIDNSFSG